jgi:DMSO/TMAO reductase YedYZ heme-binding membrane subunit
LLNRVVKPRIAHRLHVTTGVAGFSLAFAHAIMLLVFGVSGYSRAFVWVGPAVLAVLALVIVSALARRGLRRSWRWIHRLNYLIFVAILVHGFTLGYDFGAVPRLKIWFIVCAVVVAGGLAYRVTGLLKRAAG